MYKKACKNSIFVSVFGHTAIERVIDTDYRKVVMKTLEYFVLCRILIVYDRRVCEAGTIRIMSCLRRHKMSLHRFRQSMFNRKINLFVVTNGLL